MFVFLKNQVKVRFFKENFIAFYGIRYIYIFYHISVTLLCQKSCYFFLFCLSDAKAMKIMKLGFIDILKLKKIANCLHKNNFKTNIVVSGFIVN